MSRSDNPNTPLSLDSQIDEDRVRRALGLKTTGSHQTHQQRPEQARQRHRFVTDGAVPVVMINRADSETTGLKERLAASEHALENERAAHASTRRALADALASYQTLQTRFGHTELSHGEVLKTERDSRRFAEEALAAMRAEQHDTPKRRIVSEPVIVSAEPPPPTEAVAVTSVQGPVERSVDRSVERQASKPRPASTREPKPVRWWTPSFRAKKG